MLVKPGPIRTARPRAATAHDTRTMPGHLGCARPESRRADTATGAAMGRDLSQISHGLTGRYGTMASMPDIGQDADVLIRFCGALAGRAVLIYESQTRI